MLIVRCGVRVSILLPASKKSTVRIESSMFVSYFPKKKLREEKNKECSVLTLKSGYTVIIPLSPETKNKQKSALRD